jgi:hypothetical protein
LAGNRAIIRAASAASKAADYLLAFRDRELGREDQGAEIPCGEFSRPVRLRQDLLQHEGVHHAILEQMQGEHADLIILAAIADHFAAAGEEDEIVGTVPLLDGHC